VVVPLGLSYGIRLGVKPSCTVWVFLKVLVAMVWCHPDRVVSCYRYFALGWSFEGLVWCEVSRVGGYDYPLALVIVT